MTHKADGSFDVKNEASSATEAGAVVGGLIGGLVFFVFPVAGIAIGAAAGAGIGAAMGQGVPGDFVKEVEAKLEAGKSALFLEIKEANADMAIAALRKYHGEVIQTSLDEETEEALQGRARQPGELTSGASLRRGARSGLARLRLRGLRLASGQDPVGLVEQGLDLLLERLVAGAEHAEPVLLPVDRVRQQRIEGREVDLCALERGVAEHPIEGLAGHADVEAEHAGPAAEVRDRPFVELVGGHQGGEVRPVLLWIDREERPAAGRHDVRVGVGLGDVANDVGVVHVRPPVSVDSSLRQRCQVPATSPPVGARNPIGDNAGMTTRRVAWRRSDEVETDEHCTLSRRDSGLSLVGTVLGSEGGVPVRVEYRVLTDPAGFTTAVHVRDLRGFEQRTLTLNRDPKGSWTIDGQAARALKGCSDVDLGCSPSTNTLPIRRLGLGIGSAKTIQAAWIRFPGAHRREGGPDLHAARRVHVPLRERDVRGRADRRRRRPGRAVRGMAADRDRVRPGGHRAARRRALKDGLSAVQRLRAARAAHRRPERLMHPGSHARPRSVGLIVQAADGGREP